MVRSIRLLLSVILVLAMSHRWATAEPAAAVVQAAAPVADATVNQAILGQPGIMADYRIQQDTAEASTIRTYSVALGAAEVVGGVPHQWLRLEAITANGRVLRVWLLSAGYPPAQLAEAQDVVARYIIEEAGSEPLEFRHQLSGRAVLPCLGGWRYLIPRAAQDVDETPASGVLPKITDYLGHRYRLESRHHATTVPEPPTAQVLTLRPDVLIGVPHNTRQRDETRRFDDSDYDLVRLTRPDYHEMIAAGINCLTVDAEQMKWIDRCNVYHFGVGGEEVDYPECLYRSHYLGPTLFLDEPAVVTRDHVLRPRLAADPAFRQAITPQLALAAFEEHFRHVNSQGAPTRFVAGLAARRDVDLGSMTFVQQNIYSWETMVSSAAYQLSDHPDTPAALVFEPPGRVGTRRTLPEINMTYGCQIPTDDPKFLIDIIFGFLRGAARLTSKDWGTSIYGQVDRADAFWFLTHAYDLGATHFFFWDTYRLACVPYHECLALARNLRTHADSHPHRDRQQLRHAAEVAILLPPGYNLGHVHLGKGSLWGLGELNLERTNRAGVKYRVVMGNFFTEIERCLRLGVAFDLLWDLPGIRPAGYRALIRIREDGKVEIDEQGRRVLVEQARIPPRPAGAPPRLQVELTTQSGPAPLMVQARARIASGSAAVYYTLGADVQGVYQNAMAAWELFGPGAEDYRFLQPNDLRPRVVQRETQAEVNVDFQLDRPGTYRLRTATVDRAGRTAVSWNEIRVTE